MAMARSKAPYSQFREPSGFQNYQNNFIEVRCKYPEEAPKILGEPSKGGEIPLVVAPANRGCWPYLIVPEGTVAIPTNQARFLEPWDPGCYWASCFTKLTYLITKQSVMYKTKFYQIPTQENSYISIEIAVILQIQREKLSQFINKLGAAQLDNQLKANLAQDVKDIARSTTKEEAYLIRKMDQKEKQMQESLNAYFDVEYGVKITDIFILNIQLDGDVAETLEKTTISQFTKHLQKKETGFNILKQNNLESLRQWQQTRDQNRIQDDEEFKKQYEDTERTYSTYNAQTQKKMTEIQYHKELEVGKIVQEAEIFATQTKGDTEKLVVDIVSNAQKRKAELLADANAYAKNKESETGAYVAQVKAKILEIQANMEKSAISQLEVKRKYDVDKQNLEVLRNLGTNQKILIGGQSGSEINITTQIVDLQKMHYSQQMAKEVLK